MARQIVVLQAELSGFHEGAHQVAFVCENPEVPPRRRGVERRPDRVARLLGSPFNLVHQGSYKPDLDQPAEQVLGVGKHFLAGEVFMHFQQ